MGWIRRETEKGTTQYICPNCHDYHEFREDFGEQTFNENFVFCRRCGARNGTGTSAHPHPADEPLTLEDTKKERYIWFTPLNDWAKVTSFGVLFFGSEELMSWETLCEEWGYRFKAYRRRRCGGEAREMGVFRAK